MLNEFILENLGIVIVITLMISMLFVIRDIKARLKKERKTKLYEPPMFIKNENDQNSVEIDYEDEDEEENEKSYNDYIKNNENKYNAYYENQISKSKEDKKDIKEISYKNYIKNNQKIEEKYNFDFEFPELWEKKIMSGAELTFYKELKKVLPSDYYISCKCKIDDIIGCKRNQKPFRNRMKSRHFDFVIHEIEKNKILSVIELDDKSHESPERQKIDEFKNAICEKVNLKIVRFKPFTKLNNEDIKYISTPFC